ncbi:MAG: DnaD domain protein [Clostridia bacterium]
MAFTKCSNEIINNSYTIINNEFIRRYIPDARAEFVSVYIFGLYLASTVDGLNSIDTMKTALNMTEEDLKIAYSYWEEMGLCIVVDDPFSVIYNPLSSGEIYKKIKPNKYKAFNKGIQSLILDRMITPSEFNEYYIFLEECFFESQALLAVVKYCVGIKGANVGYAYILAVARNLYKQGIITQEAVNARLNNPSPYLEDLKNVLKSLSLKRAPDYTDREKYEKWTNELGFEFAVINYAAKISKHGGMEKLDAILMDYYKHKLFSIKEIDLYTENRTQNIDVAKQLVRQIGLYYQNVDFIVEDYLSKWITMGFDNETLITVAKYCSTIGIRTLVGLDNAVSRFYKLGITTLNGINQYLNSLIAYDSIIKKIFLNLGIERRVNESDRQAYKQWTEVWGLTSDIIEYAASLSTTAYNPMAYLNRLLSLYKGASVHTYEEAKKFSSNSHDIALPTKNTTDGTETREYTREELDSLFTVLDGD